MTQILATSRKVIMLFAFFKGIYTNLIQALVRQKDQFFLWVPVFLGAGIAFYFQLPAEPSLTICLSLTGITIFIGCIDFFLNKTNRRISYFFLSICLFWIGLTLVKIRQITVHTPVIQESIEFSQLEGIVKNIEILGPQQGARLLIKPTKIENLEIRDLPEIVRLKIRNKGQIQYGDTIRVLANLNPPSPPVVPGAFDFQRYAYFKSIGAIGFAYKAPEIIRHNTSTPLFYKLRQSIIEKIETKLPYPYAALAITLLTGEKGSIHEEDYDAMRYSGLAHLLAISGMHVGMAAAIVFFTVRLFFSAFAYLALRLPVKKIAACCALFVAIIYTILVGASIPTQRALIMTGFALLAIMMDRNPFSLRLVVIAALAILITAPESLINVGFQMSFAAVIALVSFYQFAQPFIGQIYRRSGVLRRVFLYFFGVILTTIIAGYATAPFSLYHFQTLSLYGVIANLISVPIMAFLVMPASVLFLVTAPFGFEEISLVGMELGLSWILATAHWISSLDGAVLRIQALPYSFLPFITLIGCFLCFWKGSRFLFFAISTIALIMIIGFSSRPDIQIADEASLIAIKNTSHKLILSKGNKERFVAENWLRLNGQKEEELITFKTQNSGVHCDNIGCRCNINGYKISVLYRAEGLSEECLWADIIISDLPIHIKNCKKPDRIIDLRKVRQDGAHSLWLDEGKVHIKTIRETQGYRPWSQFSDMSGEG